MGHRPRRRATRKSWARERRERGHVGGEQKLKCTGISIPNPNTYEECSKVKQNILESAMWKEKKVTKVKIVRLRPNSTFGSGYVRNGFTVKMYGPLPKKEVSEKKEKKR
jgi:hypothetical protein